MSERSLPLSAACERNKEPILQRLRPAFADCRNVLEIGSGTAQHAVHFAPAMPWLQWTCSDLAENLPLIHERLARGGLENVHGPLELDVRGKWPARAFDAVFTANTLHILSFDALGSLFAGIASVLSAGRLAIYGPFHYGGEPTSSGNAAFDTELKARGGGEGIRAIEDVQSLAAGHEFRLLADLAMPANNRLLLWER